MRINDLKRIRHALDEADLVLIGASNGLDMAEGLNIFAPDAHFRQAYGDLAEVTGARSILEGMYLARGNFEQAWAWQARFARCEWLDYEPGEVMRPLRKLVGDKDHFVITCNLDARFLRAGFDEHIVIETEGTIAKMVCTAGCCDERYPSDEYIRALDASTTRGAVNPKLVPTCPHCGAPLTCAVDELRLQHPDTEISSQFDAFKRVLEQHKNDNIVVLELGVGLRNGVIKSMLAQSVSHEPNVTYAVFNYSQVVFPQGLESHCIGIEGDMASAFRDMP